MHRLALIVITLSLLLVSATAPAQTRLEKVIEGWEKFLQAGRWIY